MIRKLKLIRNIGQFDSVSTGAAIDLAKLTLIYAENGRGKTTISAILRSLASGNPVPISERRRLGAINAPHVVLECDGGPSDAQFQANAWNRTIGDMMVFDDEFVDRNVYSGLVIGSEHRQNLQEVILGTEGVTLKKAVEEKLALVQQRSQALRNAEASIPVAVRGGLSLNDFLSLPAQADVAQAIETAQQRIATIQQQQQVRNKAALSGIALPSLGMDGVLATLSTTLPELETTAASRVQEHLVSLGAGGERWVADGVNRLQAMEVEGLDDCPFCAQSVSGSELVIHYRAFFGDAYAALKVRVEEALERLASDHDGEQQVLLERTARLNAERTAFWMQFAALPGTAFDTTIANQEWTAAVQVVRRALEAKAAAPLDSVSLSAEDLLITDRYEQRRDELVAVNGQITAGNIAIQAAQQLAVGGDLQAETLGLARLRAIQARHSPELSANCIAYNAAVTAQSIVHTERDSARTALETYRTQVFPKYQTAVNHYLGLFNVGFTLSKVSSLNTSSGTTLNYDVVVNNVPLTVTRGTTPVGDPSFRSILSAGDRSTLALAFFFASLQLHPHLSSQIVVIDDPVSSMDDHRSVVTIQRIRRILDRTKQVIVLSHSKYFLNDIWKDADHSLRTAMQVSRDTVGSGLEVWNVDSDCVSEHDRRHALLRSYVTTPTSNAREVALAIRPLLESFLRVAYPEFFPPSTLIGPFVNLCRQRIASPNEILNRNDVDELEDIKDYANQFHHDSNPMNYQTVVINDTALLGFVGRVLKFTQR